MLEQASQVNVAQAKYYPQISDGMNNGYSNAYSEKGFSPSFVLSVSQMLYDFGKVSSSVRSAEAGVAQEQGYQQLVKIAQDQLTALSKIGDLARQRNEEGGGIALGRHANRRAYRRGRVPR